MRMTRRRWLVAAGLGAASLPVSRAFGGQSVPYRKDRTRRVIFNDDAYQQRQHLQHIYEITDDRSFLAARTTPTFDTQVDTYVWCVGNGSEPPWGPWGLKHRAPLNPVLGSSKRVTDLVVDACHAKGIEVWGSLRMNDVHDANVPLAETNDPLKAQHPEYLIGKPKDAHLPPERLERLFWSGFNFERPEVRRHRLDFIRRNAAAHDFDGYELDFSRFIWYFPPGRERELAPLLTDFVRQVRSALDAIGRRRGRPYTLVVHVMDSVEASLRLGQDVRAWLSERLIDVLVVGMGGMPFSLRMNEWKELGARHGVPVYPSLHPRRPFRHHKELKRETFWRDWLRGTTAWSWHTGADGVYLFNLFTVRDRWRLPPDVAYAPLREVGDPAKLVGKDKIYGIESVTDGGMFSQGSEAAALPIALDIHERRLALPMGPDADHPRARFKIYIWVRGDDPKSQVVLRLNHTFLGMAKREDDVYTMNVNSKILRPGANDLRIWCNRELDAVTTPVVVREVLVSVSYCV